MRTYMEPELKVMTFDAEDILTLSVTPEDDEVVVLPEQGFGN